MRRTIAGDGSEVVRLGRVELWVVGTCGAILIMGGAAFVATMWHQTQSNAAGVRAAMEQQADSAHSVEVLLARIDERIARTNERLGEIVAIANDHESRIRTLEQRRP